MPDITMCDNKQCPLMQSCYRSTAIPTPLWQSWIHFTPTIIDGDAKCDNYISDFNRRAKDE